MNNNDCDCENRREVKPTQDDIRFQVLQNNGYGNKPDDFAPPTVREVAKIKRSPAAKLNSCAP